MNILGIKVANATDEGVVYLVKKHPGIVMFSFDEDCKSEL